MARGLLSSCGARVFSSLVVVHGSLVEACELSSCAARAYLPCSMWDLSSPTGESNLRRLHWKADSLPLDHQGSPSLASFECTEIF